MSLRAFVISVASVGLISCGGGEANPPGLLTPTSSLDGNDDSQTSMPVTGDTLPDQIIAGPPIGLNGSWFLSCRLQEPEFDSMVSETIQLDIEDDVIVATVNEFSDNACSILEQFSPETQTISVVYGETTETALGTATNIDLTVESLVVAGLEEIGSDFDDVGEMFLDILLVMNDSLFFGAVDESFDPTSPDELEPRPVDLNQIDVFTRIP